MRAQARKTANHIKDIILSANMLKMRIMISVLRYSQGYLHVPDGTKIKASIGKNGLTDCKMEGDLKTPIGQFLCRELWFRPDRLALPEGLHFTPRAITEQDGWCDDSAHAGYNRHIKLPHKAHHETLMREDGAYDLMIPLGYNDDAPQPGKGSAIFFHIAQADYAGTEGCIAINLADMLALLPHLSPQTLLVIEG
jgi:L,D-peptidoglycan transpeptidase YkuD (ErfK/YbiS/YcfS/YnhG family)